MIKVRIRVFIFDNELPPSIFASKLYLLIIKLIKYASITIQE